MRFVFVLFQLLCAQIIAYAQSQNISSLVVKNYVIVNDLVMKFPVSYGDTIISGDFEMLKTKKPYQIDYLYTDINTWSGQEALNKVRIRNFLAKMERNYNIPIQIIKQDHCKVIEECKDEFHGFIVYYVDNNKYDLRMKELFKVDSALSYCKSSIGVVENVYCRPPMMVAQLSGKFSREIKDSVDVEIFLNEVGVCDSVVIEEFHRTKKYKRQILKKFSFFPASIGNRYISSRIKAKVLFPIQINSVKEFQWTSDSLYKKGIYHTKFKNKCIIRTEDSEKLSTSFFMADSTLIIVDVTSSMMDTILDLINWFHLKGENLNHVYYSFFNDYLRGRTTESTVPNSVYFGNQKSFRKKILKAMKVSGGGDAPENLGQAIDRSMRRYEEKSYENIIIITDGRCFPHDLLPNQLIDFRGKNISVFLANCLSHQDVDINYFLFIENNNITILNDF